MNLDDVMLRLDQLEVRVAALEKKKKPAPSDDWLAELKANPLYQHINFDVEMDKIARWKLKPMNVNRQITRKFLINWLNKVDVPVELGSAMKPPPPPPKNDPIGRGQWKRTYGRPEDYGYL